MFGAVSTTHVQGDWLLAGLVAMRRLIGMFAAACLLAAILGPARESSLTQASQSASVVIPGHVPKILSSSKRQNPVVESQKLSITVRLRPRDAVLLQSDSEAQRAGLPTFQFSTPTDFCIKYGQSDDAIRQVQDYFASFGLLVGQPEADRLSFKADGTVGQIEKALSVQISEYTDSKNQQFYSADVDPRLPSNLAGSIEAILGLDNYPWAHPLARIQSPTPGLYSPSDIWTAYNYKPLLDRGVSGTGQTIGIIGCGTFNPGDIQQFESVYSLPHASVSEVRVDGGSFTTSDETALDIEWSSAIATGSAIRV